MEIEQLRRQLELVAEQLRRAESERGPEADSLRALVERTRAALEARVSSGEVERLARAQRQQVEESGRVREARAALDANQQRVRELVDMQRTVAERQAREVSVMDADRQQLQDLLRRLQEAMRRIP
jgi:hypothetical protein